MVPEKVINNPKTEITTKISPKKIINLVEYGCANFQSSCDFIELLVR